MPIIQPDTTNMVEIKPLEPGPYRAKVVKVTPGVSKAGNPKIDVEFEVQAEGRTIPRTVSLGYTGKGTQGFDHFLRAGGFSELADQYRDPNVQPKPPFDTDDFLGIEMTVHVVPNLYEGKMRDQIDDYTAA